MSKPTNAARAEVARNLATELRAIETQISFMERDAHACHFHRATIRLHWLRGSIKSCADGLAQQAGKLKNPSTP